MGGTRAEKEVYFEKLKALVETYRECLVYSSHAYSDAETVWCTTSGCFTVYLLSPPPPTLHATHLPQPYAQN